MEIVFNKVSFVINKNTPLEKTILNNVSFSITEPLIYSFVGSSNSGKTAIGELISFLHVPTKGDVKIGRYKNNGKNKKTIYKLKRQIGYVFKNPYDMFFNDTVLKEISYAIDEFGYKKESKDKRIIEALKLVDLDESYLDKNPMELNLVDAKKIALACILIYNPKLIILDEITNGLSVSDKNKLIRLLKQLKNKYRKTIILLTKDTSFAYQITDYVFLMNYTRLICSGKRDILEDSELLKNNHLEPPKIVSFVNAYNKKGRDLNYYNNILDLIKGVYRDVF